MLTERQTADFLLMLRCERKYAPSSMAQTIVALRTFFRDHLGLDWTLWKTVRVRQSESLPWVLSREEVAAVIGAARLMRFRVLFTLIYHCGLRLGEAIRIAPRDIDAKALRIHIRHAKGGKDRYVPVSAGMEAQLRAFWYQHCNQQWMFPGLGRGWKGLKNTAEEAAKKSALPQILCTQAGIDNKTSCLRRGDSRRFQPLIGEIGAGPTAPADACFAG